MAGTVKKDHSQKGGHRWRIFDWPMQVLDQTGAVRAKAEIIPTKITIRPTGKVAAVSPATLTTILTYTATVPSWVRMIRVSGELPARVEFLYNTVLQETKRLTSDRNVKFDFPDMLFWLDTGDIIDIKVYHNFTGETSSYEATLYGAPQ